MGGFNFHDYIFLFGPISAVYILFFFSITVDVPHYFTFVSGVQHRG